MDSLFELLSSVADDLESIGARWALIGGLAVGVRTEPRFTRDVDLAVMTSSDDDAERFIFSLRDRGYRIAAVLEQSKNGRLATVRLLPPADDRLVDLLFCSSGIEDAVVQAASHLEITPGFSAPVAAPGHLIAMKILARDDKDRPQDRLDLKALLRISDSTELTRAEDALASIVDAGLHRGRDLKVEFQRARAELL